MISVRQAPTPEAICVMEEAERRYAVCIASGMPIPDAVMRAYRHQHVKGAIKAETCEKCLYCESRITHISYGDVEHILPKAHRPDLMFNYENLSLACTICNNSKRDYHDESAPLLNPYVDEPSEHLTAAGPMVVRLRGSRLGQLTELTLRLNRSELLDRRRDRLAAVTSLVDQYHREREDGLKEAIARELWREADRCAEFSMVVAAYLSSVCDIPRPKNVQPEHGT